MKPFFAILSTAAAACSPALAPDSVPAAEPTDILWSVAWHPDGTSFAVGGIGTLSIFDADGRGERALIEGSFTTTALGWDPSGRFLASSDQDGRENRIDDLQRGAPLHLEADHGRGVAWNPSGDRIATSSAGDGHLRIWTRAGELLHDHPRHEDARGLTGVAWSPSGERIVTIGTRIALRDADGNVLARFVHRSEALLRSCLLLCVAWHPSGDFFAVGDYGNELDDPVLQLWSATGELVKSIAIEGGREIRNVRWNPAGTRLASASERLRVWTADGELVGEGRSPDHLWGLDWHPGGERILTSSQTGRISLWDEDARWLADLVEAASER